MDEPNYAPNRQIRLRTLGSLDLETEAGNRVQSVLQQPKRLAVLLYLALARPRGFHRRDTLLGLFWAETDQDRARKALNQAVHWLRRSLGKDSILSRGDDELGIDPDLVRCDAVELEVALENGRAREAVDLYRGDLLPGFYIEDTPGFDRWLDNERTRLRGLAANAAWTLSAAAEQSGDGAAAASWGERAAQIEPEDEKTVRRLMELYDRQGDRLSAVRTYDDFARRLAAEYELTPSADTRQLAETIRARVDAPVAPARSVTPPPPVPATPPPQPAAVTEPELVPSAAAVAVAEDEEQARDVGGPADALTRWRTLVAGVAALVLIAVVGVFLVRLARDSATPADVAPGPPTSIAVLYFDDYSREQQLGYLASGITDALITELSRVDALSVISKNGVRPFRASSVPLDSIARVLRVGSMVGGSVERSGDKLRIRVQLIDAASGRAVNSDVITRDFGDDFALVDDVVREVSQFLRVHLGRSIELKRWQAGTSDVEAWKLLRAADDMRQNAETMRRSQGSGGAAVAALENADRSAELAHRRAPDWSEPLVLRSRIAEDRAWIAYYPIAGGHLKWFDRALEFADEAVNVAPNDASALEQRGAVLFYRAEMAAPNEQSSSRDHQLAREALEAAVAKDASRARAWSILSLIAETSARYSDAKVAAERAYAADAYLRDSMSILTRLFFANFELRDDAEAERWCGEIGRRFAHTASHALCALHLMAWGAATPSTNEAWRIANDLRSDPPQIQAAMQPHLKMLVAAVIARGGLADSARHVIARADQEGRLDMERLFLKGAALALAGDRAQAVTELATWVRANPGPRSKMLESRRFTSLRSDSQFNALLRSAGEPPAQQAFTGR